MICYGVNSTILNEGLRFALEEVNTAYSNRKQFFEEGYEESIEEHNVAIESQIALFRWFCFYENIDKARLTTDEINNLELF